MSSAQSEVNFSMSEDSKPSKLRVTISRFVDTELAYEYESVLPRKGQDDRPGARTARSQRAHACARQALRARDAARAAVPGWLPDRRFRSRLLLGRGAEVLGGRRRLHDRGRLRRWVHA